MNVKYHAQVEIRDEVYACGFTDVDIDFTAPSGLSAEQAKEIVIAELVKRVRFRSICAHYDLLNNEEVAGDN